MSLVNLQAAVNLGYDAETIAPKLERAETRVMGYLRGRSTAALILAGQPAPLALQDVVCSIASRMANINPRIEAGIQSSSGSDGTSVTYGMQALAGVSGLMDSEEEQLDRLYPRKPFTIETL